MQNINSLWERIKSDTPIFFKRLQFFGLGLAGLGTSLGQLQGIPGKLTTILITAGGAIAVVAQFAVKQTGSISQ